MTLSHLLTLIAVIVVGTFAGREVAFAVLQNPRDPFLPPLMLILAGLIAFVLCSPVFKLFGLRPLLLPMCPRCLNLHANYHVPRALWPDSGVVVCAHCGQGLRLSLGKKCAPIEQECTLPAVSLSRPFFLGLWNCVPIYLHAKGGDVLAVVEWTSAISGQLRIIATQGIAHSEQSVKVIADLSGEIACMDAIDDKWLTFSAPVATNTGDKQREIGTGIVMDFRASGLRTLWNLSRTWIGIVAIVSEAMLIYSWTSFDSRLRGDIGACIVGVALFVLAVFICSYAAARVVICRRIATHWRTALSGEQ